MEYRILGRTGVRVSSLCFGTMSFGGDADEDMAAAMFRRCRDAGINFFDCADVYNRGRSEGILGRLIRGSRDELVITSKVMGQMGEDINARGLSRRHIMLAVEASLRRLGTDRLDLYFLHNWDPSQPMEEPLRALEDLTRQGKIVYPAVSNWAAWQVATGLGIQSQRGWTRFECLQPMYNLVKRQAEVEILPLAQAQQLGVITYSPLGGGLLSGKYGSEARPAHGRLVENPLYAKRYGQENYYETADRLVAHARERGVHPATLAVAWVMSHPAVTAPIIGARNLEQLEPSLAAAELQMTPEWRAEISSFSPEPPPATDRSEEMAR
ncbi:MAG: aldo/keto reductase [Anaerolineae bacterium]|jgi:aryl-alcohol dehydrogenase-like predicted oxidoreductase